MEPVTAEGIVIHVLAGLTNLHGHMLCLAGHWYSIKVNGGSLECKLECK